jgi:hypothetical protein
MCAGKSYQQPTGESSVTGNTVRSVYRVLRGVPRGTLRSVDRNSAGRNAASVKVLSPVKHVSTWWPSNYLAAKATSEDCVTTSGGSGTTGVRVHGMLKRLLMEPRRSLRSRAWLLRMEGRRLMTESNRILRGEVRCFRSSEEVE